MSDLIIRPANINDVSFLVDTIIEAEKSGTNKLSYTTIFNLTENEARKYLESILEEEVDGCELSISSFMVAEKNGRNVAAVSSWIEGFDGLPSSILKGNLLNYTLPKECINNARNLSNIISQLYIENSIDSIHLGLVFVSPESRGMNLVNLLIEEVISRLKKNKPQVDSMYVQVFDNNIPAIKAYEKSGFNTIKEQKANNSEILNYLPSDGKILMKKDI